MSKRKELLREFLLVERPRLLMKLSFHDDIPILVRKAVPYKGRLLYFLIGVKEGRDSFVVVPGFKASKEYLTENNVKAVKISPVRKEDHTDIQIFIEKRHPNLIGLPFNF